MKYLSVLALAVLILSSCNKGDCNATNDLNCVCIKIYDPVCGCNDKTYSNSCLAECAGIEKYTKGICN